MSKPKNREGRSVTFTRGSRPPQSPAEPQEITNEIPRGSKQEIRHMIEVEGATSTTKIAERLNEDKYPTASGVLWTASLVDSALRRQDMEGLRERMRDNRGEVEPDGPSLLEIKQAAYDGAKDAIGDVPALKLPEIPPVKLDTFAVKGAVADATAHAFKGFRKQMDEANAGVAADVTSRVQEAMAQFMTTSDLPNLRRITDATGRNVGDIHKRLDALCEDVYDSTVRSLKEHSEAVVAACETMGEALYERVDERFDRLEDRLIAKFTTGMDIDLDAALGRVVDTRLKAHLDEAINRFAYMVENLRKELAEEKTRKGR